MTGVGAVLTDGCGWEQDVGDRDETKGNIAGGFMSKSGCKSLGRDTYPHHPS